MKWYYCDRCETVCVKCDSCGNSSCNGGGCEICDDDFKISHQMIENGTAPLKDGLPVHSRKWAIKTLFTIVSLSKNYDKAVCNLAIDYVSNNFTDTPPTEEEIIKILGDMKP
jgi:hypothetical protein